MFRVMNDYMKEMKLQVSEQFYNKIKDCLEKNNAVSSYCITVNFNRYIIDIKLKHYTIDEARTVYQALVSCIACPYSELSVRYNEGKAVRYRYATCAENKQGYYCDIVFGPKL